ncbi:MAG: hypothetical protein C5B48_11525 [Candidatus Rokuibacteriota bacterium]|nr:MAG: hypothetical protein C5B48_11525 [Candidatus Rokubacteria bacterium]
MNDRSLKIAFQPEWDPAGTGAPAPRGLFAADPRVKTLLKVLVSYPEVRYVLPDRISLDAAATMPLLETIARFLDRQSWLVRHVTIG